GWGQAFAATAGATLLSKAAPGLLSRATDTVRQRLADFGDSVEDDEADLDEDGINGTDRRGQQPDPGRD
ncbi:hypothetical protein DKX15_22530, partial [Enterococcus faecium]